MEYDEARGPDHAVVGFQADIYSRDLVARFSGAPEDRFTLCMEVVTIRYSNTDLGVDELRNIVFELQRAWEHVIKTLDRRDSVDAFAVFREVARQVFIRLGLEEDN